MLPVERGRLCTACNEVVHDLSSMSEAEAQKLLERAEGRLCVRYLYDVHGKVVFGSSWPKAARIVPASRLTVRLRKRLAQASLLAAPLLIEACGGTSGDYSDLDAAKQPDASDAGGHRAAADAGVADAGDGASDEDGGDATPDARH